jgi:hypothetical protein
MKTHLLWKTEHINELLQLKLVFLNFHDKIIIAEIRSYK